MKLVETTHMTTQQFQQFMASLPKDWEVIKNNESLMVRATNPKTNKTYTLIDAHRRQLTRTMPKYWVVKHAQGLVTANNGSV